jgi:hypothetical protein
MKAAAAHMDGTSSATWATATCCLAGRACTHASAAAEGEEKDGGNVQQRGSGGSCQRDFDPGRRRCVGMVDLCLGWDYNKLKQAPMQWAGAFAASSEEMFGAWASQVCWNAATSWASSLGGRRFE